MSLLREIQNEAADNSKPVASLLRKCKILAARLKNPEFTAWVDNELNGYPSGAVVPEYRDITTHSYCSAGNGYQTLDNVPIPIMTFPAELRDKVTQHRLLGGIDMYEQMALKGEDFRRLWPPALTALFEKRMVVQNGRVLEAWWLITNTALVNLIGSVRNRILAFSLEIENENPAAGEASPGEQPVPSDKVGQILHMHIYGGTNNVAAASSNVAQTINILGDVRRGDLQSLREHLSKLGLTKSDLDEMETALTTAEPVVGSNELSTPLKAWIGGMVYKAATGAWEISAGAAGGLLTNAISAYLGLGGG